MAERCRYTLNSFSEQGWNQVRMVPVVHYYPGVFVFLSNNKSIGTGVCKHLFKNESLQGAKTGGVLGQNIFSAVLTISDTVFIN